MQKSIGPSPHDAENAVVLHALDAGGAGAGDGFVVDDLVLQPEIGNAEPNHVVDDGRHVLGGAKDVDQIDSLPGPPLISFSAAACAASRSG